VPHNAAGVDTEWSDVCVIPLMWGPHFIGGGTPKETLDKIELLVAAAPAAADQDACESIQQWGRCSCVAAGNLGAEVNQPGSAVMWRVFPWGTQHNAWPEGRFKAVCRLPEAPRPAAAAGSGSSLDHALKMAQAIVIGMQGAAAAEKEKKEKFNEQERLKTLAACGLHEGAWDMVPPICEKMTENGKTKSTRKLSGN
jgi:hypothetical protein